MRIDPEDARLTAYALDELDAAEREEVRRMLERSPAARETVERVRRAAALLSAALADEEARVYAAAGRKAAGAGAVARLSGGTAGKHRPSAAMRAPAGWQLPAAMAAGIVLVMGLGLVRLVTETGIELRSRTTAPVHPGGPRAGTGAVDPLLSGERAATEALLAYYQYDRPKRVEVLFDFIRNTIEPGSWREQGGEVAAIDELGGQLIVTQTASAHGQLVNLLRQLRKHGVTETAIESFVNSNGSFGGATLHADSRGNAEVYARLESAIRVDFTAHPFEEVIEELGTQQGISIKVHWDTLEAMGIDRGLSVTLQHASEVKLKDALKEILDQVTRNGIKLGFRSDGGALVIAPRAFLHAGVYVDVYPIEHLLEHRSVLSDHMVAMGGISGYGGTIQPGSSVGLFSLGGGQEGAERTTRLTAGWYYWDAQSPPGSAFIGFPPSDEAATVGSGVVSADARAGLAGTIDWTEGPSAFERRRLSNLGSVNGSYGAATGDGFGGGGFGGGAARDSAGGAGRSAIAVQTMTSDDIDRLVEDMARGARLSARRSARSSGDASAEDELTPWKEEWRRILAAEHSKEEGVSSAGLYGQELRGSSGIPWHQDLVMPDRAVPSEELAQLEATVADLEMQTAELSSLMQSSPNPDEALHVEPQAPDPEVAELEARMTELQSIAVTGQDVDRELADVENQLQETRRRVLRRARAERMRQIEVAYYNSQNSLEAARERLEVYRMRLSEPEVMRVHERAPQVHENPFVAVAAAPLSTFSIDVDTASYALVRQHLSSGTLPPAHLVRIEELINYFSYDYPEPNEGEPFSVTVDVVDCPWNADHLLARIGLRGAEVSYEERPESNLVFLIDVSGSMEDENKLPLLKDGLALLLEELDGYDRMAIVTYAEEANLLLPPTPCDRRAAIQAFVDRLEASGGTNGGAGLELAYEIAAENYIEGGINRVIVATDGDFNIGTTEDGELVRLIEEKKETGVFLTVLGLGSGNYRDSRLEGIADRGNGAYAYIDSLDEARKVLVEELAGTLLTVAKDVKVQVEFNPAAAESYRLIGYENRMLATADFANDAKDAGEFGAGQTVTAIYEIAPPPLEGEVPEDVSTDGVERRYADWTAAEALAEQGELMTVSLRYKLPEGSESKLVAVTGVDEGHTLAEASDDMRFASAVAGFGMLLRNSAHKGTATWELVYELAEGGLGDGSDPHRVEFLGLVESARERSASTAQGD